MHGFYVSILSYFYSLSLKKKAVAVLELEKIPNSVPIPQCICVIKSIFFYYWYNSQTNSVIWNMEFKFRSLGNCLKKERKSWAN